jgi:uncharacterized protein YbaA (DUF1428 family)
MVLAVFVVQVNADKVDSFRSLAGKSRPMFQLWKAGEIVDTIEGANGPVLSKSILTHLGVSEEVCFS